MLMPNWEEEYDWKDVHGNKVLAIYLHRTNNQFACYVYQTPVGTVYSSDDKSLLYRKAKEKKYRPYKHGEVSVGQVFLGPDNGKTVSMVIAVSSHGVYLGHSDSCCTYSDLLCREWKNQDGSPAGVLE